MFCCEFVVMADGGGYLALSISGRLSLNSLCGGSGRDLFWECRHADPCGDEDFSYEVATRIGCFGIVGAGEIGRAHV